MHLIRENYTKIIIITIIIWASRKKINNNESTQGEQMELLTIKFHSLQGLNQHVFPRKISLLTRNKLIRPITVKTA